MGSSQYRLLLLFLNVIILSLSGNHTIAVIKGQESYDILKDSCADLFKAVNNIIKKGCVTVDGRDIEIEMFLGGDYKVK